MPGHPWDEATKARARDLFTTTHLSLATIRRKTGVPAGPCAIGETGTAGCGQSVLCRRHPLLPNERESCHGGPPRGCVTNCSAPFSSAGRAEAVAMVAGLIETTFGRETSAGRVKLRNMMSPIDGGRGRGRYGRVRRGCSGPRPRLPWTGVNCPRPTAACLGRPPYGPREGRTGANAGTVAREALRPHYGDCPG